MGAMLSNAMANTMSIVENQPRFNFASDFLAIESVMIRHGGERHEFEQMYFTMKIVFEQPESERMGVSRASPGFQFSHEPQGAGPDFLKFFFSRKRTNKTQRSPRFPFVRDMVPHYESGIL